MLLPGGANRPAISMSAEIAFVILTGIATYHRFPFLSLMAAFAYACAPTFRIDAAGGIVLLTQSLLARTRFFEEPMNGVSTGWATVAGWLSLWTLLLGVSVSDHHDANWQNWFGPALVLAVAIAAVVLALVKSRRRPATPMMNRGSYLVKAFFAGLATAVAGYIVYFVLSMVIDPPESVGGSATRTVTMPLPASSSTPSVSGKR